MPEKYLLPEGWRWVRLGEVCEPTQNRDPRSTPELSFQYVDISSVDNNSKRIIEARTILGKDAPSRAKQVIRTNDLLVSTTRPNLNAVALVTKELDSEICSTGFCVLKPTEAINPLFLFAFVQTQYFIDTISNQVRGMLYPAVTDHQIRDVYLPLPPIETQHRIAAKLQEFMQEVERARKSCEKQLESAKTLPSAYLREVFESNEAKGWERKRLGEVGSITDGDWILTTDYSSDGVRLLQVGDISIGKFIGKSSRFISIERARELNCTFLEPGDILISRMPDPIGRACQLPDISSFCITAVDVSIWRPKIDDREYLIYYLNSPDWFARVKTLAAGATRLRISRSNLETMQIPIPPIPTQHRIAVDLKEKMLQIDKLRAIIEKQLETINALPQVVLRKAFGGEL